eukprot:CAMPEP_0179281788 /NCGR_PEP_ID=MMETSP0797-20121207/37334_1 /TAXON_ID=47934 /ORGANISM="Dinophysis acuminata, Strain DAEP01" /LENGTH=123 /DNA_ID=CAMNT_0020990507 /DNA_START=102 /DNA_END=473 /DNA_ORIENTATION=-
MSFIRDRRSRSSSSSISSLSSISISEVMPPDKEFTITLTKTSPYQKIGLDLQGVPLGPKDEPAFVVMRLKDGLVSEWNKLNPGEEVLGGDIMVDVNDVHGDCGKMYNVFVSETTLKVTIVRMA